MTHALVLGLAMSRSKAEDLVTSLGHTLTVHTVYILAADAPERTIDKWLDELGEYWHVIGAVRLKRSHRPLKAKDILTWLEPYISLATVHLAFAKLRHKGIPVKPSWRDRDVLAAMEELIRTLARKVERGRLNYDRALEILRGYLE